MTKYIKIITSILAVLLLLVSLVPLLMLAPYAAPASDDFGYATPIYYAIKNNSGFLGVLKAIADNIYYTYHNWQGTFASVFLFSLQPEAFSEGLYVLTPFITVPIIIAPAYIAMSTVFRLETWGKVLIGSVISLIAVQFLPSAADGIYWWNGAMHYLVFWCLFVLVITQQVRLSRYELRGGALYSRLAFTCFGAFCVGGGNYSTALISAVLLAAVTLYNSIKRKARAVLFANSIVTVFSILGLIINVIAPGNAVRQSGLEKMSVISAIGTSFYEAAKALVTFTDLKILCALLLCIPVFLLSAKNIRYRFRYPLIVLIGSLCIFAAMYTPPLYAMGTSDVARINNMLYMAYLVLVFGNAFYLAGWVSRRYEANTRILGSVGFIGAVAVMLSLSMQLTASNAYLAYSDLNGNVLQDYIQERDARAIAYENNSAYSHISEYPACFVRSKHLTWSPAVFVNGVPSDLMVYRSCGGEVTFVGLEDALSYFDYSNVWYVDDFSKVYYADDKICIPLREFVQKQGFGIDYDGICDTIYIETK